MIELKYVELSDRQWIDPLMKKTHYMGCDNCFGCLYIWKDMYQSRVAQLNGFALFENTYGGKTSYLFPLGEGDLKKTIGMMIKDFKQRGKTLCFHGVEPSAREFLQNNFPGGFSFEEYRDGFDYIYNATDLIELAGKKYHSKRNHIANFMRDYDWRFEEITKDNMDDCIEMNKEWCRQNHCGDDPQLMGEQVAVHRAIDNFFNLGLKGGILRVEGKAVAFSMGEEINSQVFGVHIEKAFSDVQGAYTMINREFAKAFCADYQYINREDDVGIEGLRKAKLSYYPAILLPKCMAEYKGE